MGISSYDEMLLAFPLLALLLLALFLLWPSSSGGKQDSRINRGIGKKKLPLPPSPPGGLPIIGHLHLIGGDKQPHIALGDLAKKHGDLMLLRLGAVSNLVVSSARAAEAVMRTHDHIFASRPESMVVNILMKGSMDVAFAPYGEQWRQTRKLVTAHMLSVKKVRSFGHARHEEVRLAMARIRDHASTVVDMSDLLYSFTNDIVCRAVSGKFFMEEGRNQLFRQLIGLQTALLDGFNVQDYFPRLAQFGLLTRVMCGNKANKLQERWHDLLDKLIDGHASKPIIGKDHDAHNEQETDFIDVLLSLQQEYGLTRNQMKAILMDMFAAGTDTSYITMDYALAELVRNPHVMAKLQAEVRMNTPKGQEMVMEENLGNMAYLKAVIKETLRLHPPAPLLLPHYSITDCSIDGYMIPAQTRVIINAWVISRDSRSWDRAEEFMPERFITGSTLGVDLKGSDFQFTPFGAGRRICPGLNFALATVETMLANLIYCFDWELPTGMGKEDIDMTDMFGLTMHRKEKLFLVPKPISCLSCTGTS